MKVLFLLAFAVTTAISIPLDDANDVEWKQYKTKYNKSYESEAVDKVRKQIYFTKKADIAKHNERYANNETSYYRAVNKFTDMLAVEVAQMLNGYKSGQSHKAADREIFDATEDEIVDLPKTVDWRKKNVVTPVKNQQQCGSCWAFSTTGSLEGAHALNTKKLVSLSEQNLVDCSSKEGNEGCDGGLMDYAFKYIKKNHGIDTEASYPYTGMDGKCHFKRKDVGATLKSWVDVKSGSEKALQKASATIGPISVAIDASQDSFNSYAGGVYDEPNCSTTQLDHGVLVVGYGTHRGKPYWLVKNSWGTDWGIKGYIMMSRNKQNQCGIATEASYPVVA